MLLKAHPEDENIDLRFRSGFNDFESCLFWALLNFITEMLNACFPGRTDTENISI